MQMRRVVRSLEVEVDECRRGRGDAGLRDLRNDGEGQANGASLWSRWRCTRAGPDAVIHSLAAIVGRAQPRAFTVGPHATGHRGQRLAERGEIGGGYCERRQSRERETKDPETTPHVPIVYRNPL